MIGLEPTRLTAPDPKSGAAAITPLALAGRVRCRDRTAAADRVLFDQTVFAEHFLELVEGEFNLLLGVGGHEREADESVLRSDRGGYHGVHEETLVEELAGDMVGLVVVADEEGDDRGAGFADFAAHIAESLEGEVGYLPEVFLALRLLLHYVDCLEGGGGGGGSDRGCEDIGAGMVAEEVGDFLVGCDEAAEGSERLGEGAHDEVDILCHSEVVAGAAAPFAEDADAVGLVDHHRRVVFLREAHDFGEVCYVTFH